MLKRNLVVPGDRQIFDFVYKYNTWSTHVTKGSNLIFQYKFMVLPPAVVHTFEILIIFWMGKITVYLTRVLAQQCLVCCIPKLPGNSQFFTLFPTGKSFLVLQSRQLRQTLAENILLLMVYTSTFVCLYVFNPR